LRQAWASPQRCTLGRNVKGFIPRVNEVISRSEESEHPGQSQIAQAFPRLSPSTSEFLFLQSKQQQQVWQKATVMYAICMTSVKGIRTNACAAGARVSRPMHSPPVSRTVTYDTADNRSRQRSAARAVDEQIGGACVCHAHACVPCVHLAL